MGPASAVKGWQGPEGLVDAAASTGLSDLTNENDIEGVSGTSDQEG